MNPKQNYQQGQEPVQEPVSIKKIVSLVVIGVVIIFGCFQIPRIYEDVKNEKIVVNQFPFSGRMAYWTTPGFNWQWFGKITEYHKTEQLWFGSTNDEGKQEGNPHSGHLQRCI